VLRFISFNGMYLLPLETAMLLKRVKAFDCNFKG
jgi:hypothetical protein